MTYLEQSVPSEIAASEFQSFPMWARIALITAISTVTLVVAAGAIAFFVLGVPASAAGWCGGG